MDTEMDPMLRYSTSQVHDKGRIGKFSNGHISGPIGSVCHAWCGKVENIGKKYECVESWGSRAIRSIPAYVERSDFILILVPSLYHSDRKVPTCYRTWRRRGWCLLELYAAAMARDPQILRCCKERAGTPMWIIHWKS